MTWFWVGFIELVENKSTETHHVVYRVQFQVVDEEIREVQGGIPVEKRLGPSKVKKQPSRLHVDFLHSLFRQLVEKNIDF